MIEILETDKVFQDSPFEGQPSCICSRCNNHIAEKEGPIIRAFVDEGRGGEYRYCRSCMEKVGVTFFDNDDEDFDENEQDFITD